MGDWTGGRNTAIDQFQRDGDRVWKGVQMIANHDGGVQEAVRCSKIDQRLNRDGRLTRYEEVHQKGEVARGGKRQGKGGEGKSATQPGSY